MIKSYKKFSAISLIAFASTVSLLHADEEPKKTGPELSISGYFAHNLRTTSQSYGSAWKDENGVNTGFTSQYSTGHGFNYTNGYNVIYFNAAASTDSGMDYSANYELAVMPDVKSYRAYLEFGMGAGNFQFGQTYSASTANLIDGGSVLSGTGGWNAQAAVPFFDSNGTSATNVANNLGYFSPDIAYIIDSNGGIYTPKIAYKSPKLNGLSLGYSFTPNGNVLEKAGDTKNNNLPVANAFVNVHNVAVNYEYETTDFGVFLYGGYISATNDNKKYNNARAFALGAKFVKDDLQIAVGFQNNGKGSQDKKYGGNNGGITDVGVSYTIDDIKLGAGVGVYRADNPKETDAITGDLVSGGKTRGTFYSAGASSELAKGLVGYMEFNRYVEDPNNKKANDTIKQSEVILGASVAF